MKLKSIFLVLLISQAVFAAKKIVRQPLDFTLMYNMPADNEVVYGYSNPFFIWENWLARKSSGPLLVPIEPPNQIMEVFEARSAGIIAKPVSYFSKALLHNINTVRSLDPTNTHTVIPGQSNFTIETTIPFPPTWSKVINFAKSIGQLAEKTTDKIIATSEFRYIDVRSSPPSNSVENIINKLNVYRTRPDIINLQGLLKINQIAKFGSMITFFYALDSQKTLVVNYFAMGIKRKDLNKGFTDYDGRTILMGENSFFNTDSGIGAGLPKYVESMFRSQYDYFEERGN
jgi:hypothetical protein